MGVPTDPLTLMINCYKKVFPIVHNELYEWKNRAKAMPDEELRQQALTSIETKQFHSEGGAILSLLAGEHYEDIVSFIVAYQTISDYLDNLCDRSTSQSSLDFRTLHQAMNDALTVGVKPENYYRFRDEQEDGGYLAALVQRCQQVLARVPHYDLIKDELIELCQIYCDLQVHKHVKLDERETRLKNWFQIYRKQYPHLTWYEFAACAGSTLGIFCLVAYGMQKELTIEQVKMIRNGYFPYIQGLHILLDYFIDQEEDVFGGDLNFCSYYENNEHLFERFRFFIVKAEEHTRKLPNEKFHQMIHRGLLGLYLSDNKLETQPETEILAKKLLKQGGLVSLFFYLNAKLYRKKQSRII